MLQTSIEFTNIFVRSPGELLYFCIVILVALSGVFMTLSLRFTARSNETIHRFAIAFAGMVFIWLMLLIGLVFSLANDRQPVTILPPLERFSFTTTLLLLIWAFLAGSLDSAKRYRILLGAGFLASIIAYVITALEWSKLVGTEDFNLSVYGVGWTIVSFALSIGGILLIIVNFRRIEDAPLKFVMLFLLATGFGWTLLQVTQGNIIGNYAGSARLAFVMALLVTLVIVYRAVIGLLMFETPAPYLATVSPSSRTSTSETSTPSPPVRAPIERESVQLLRALGLILEDASAENIPEKVVDAVIQVLKVDFAGLLRLQDANYADFITANDAFMNKSLTPMALNLDHQPTLANAVERRDQRRILPDENDDEIQDLYTRLEIAHVGPVYFQPLTHDRELVAMLVIAQPYTQRELYKAETEMLKGVAVIAGGLLALSFAAIEARIMAEERAIHAMIRGVPAETVNDSDVITARQETEASLQLAREQITQLSKQVAQLSEELEVERNRVALSLDELDDDLTVSQRFKAVTEEQHRIANERDMLARRLQEAEAALAGATATDSEAVVRQMIDAFEREKSDLEAQRARLQKELKELRSGDSLPQIARNIIDEINAQKQVLEVERDQLKADLDAIQNQLGDIGIDAGTGLSHLINQLYQQNADLLAENIKLRSEVELMTSERSRLNQAIEREEARAMRIQMLESEIKNLAEDREALAKHRDKLRTERDELHKRVDEIKKHRARLMAQVASYEVELEEGRAVQSKLHDNIRKLSNQNSDLVSERDRLISAKAAAETDREQILAMMQGDRDRLQVIGEQGVGALKSMIETLTEQRNAMQHELGQTRTALAAAQNKLDVLQKRVEENLPTNVSYQSQDPELFLGLVQELRTPMTSIRGYVDLLLAESAGILGEMQRKFLQRVFTNSSRLEAMIDDLVQVTQLDAGKLQLEESSVDVVALIENAITQASPQFREKGLTINLMLDEDAPIVQGDGDAISQIIGQLLTNAYLVSPPDSSISIRAENRTVKLSNNGAVEPVDCLYVSVEDRGGGIQSEDEERVFARKYRADHPLIEGLGDTGVGLSVAKALAEAHGGVLWMRSRENVGTAFNFALPVKRSLQSEERMNES